MNKITKVKVEVRPMGKVAVTVMGVAYNGKSFTITSADCGNQEVAQKIDLVANDLDLSFYPYDGEGSSTPLGAF